jgi:hypothetical protein
VEQNSRIAILLVPHLSLKAAERVIKTGNDKSSYQSFPDSQFGVKVETSQKYLLVSMISALLIHMVSLSESMIQKHEY